jgi:hypothetical protein
MAKRHPRARTLAALIAALAAGCAVESSAPTDVTSSSSGEERTATTDEAVLDVGACLSNCPGKWGENDYEFCSMGCLEQSGGGGVGVGGGAPQPLCQPKCTRCAHDASRGPGLWRTCTNRKCDSDTIACGTPRSPNIKL